jgi:hypothetical protein
MASSFTAIQNSPIKKLWVKNPNPFHQPILFMWNPFRKRPPNSPPKEFHTEKPKTNHLENWGAQLLGEGRLQELEQKLGEMDVSALPSTEQESWWNLYGIAAFRGGQEDQALERFLEAHKRFPDSPRIRFSLGQQYIRTRTVDQGFELFRTCRFPQIPQEYALAQARYAYLWNRYADGFVFLKPFFEAYKQVRILDDHFLYVRGLPFFGRWWAYLAAFSILAGELEELESSTAYVIRNCRDYDFETLKSEWVAYRENNPQHLQRGLEKRLSQIQKNNLPSGYTRLNMAVIKARYASPLEAAQELLAEVALSDRDAPWLENVRTLALAEAAHRFDDFIQENERVETFLKNQPLLLEPDKALTFQLLHYQETLKPKILHR